MRLLATGVAAILAAVSVPESAAAAVLDQDSFFAGSENPFGATSVRAGPLPYPQQIVVQIAQSVTAGTSGQLVQIDLQLGRRSGSAPLVVSLGRGEVTDAEFEVFGSVEIPAADIAAFDAVGINSLSVDLSGLGFEQAEGDLFTILLSVTPGAPLTNYGWIFGDITDDGSTPNPIAYAGGRAKFSQDGGISWIDRPYDRGFRTYVDAAGAVPEPATWAMLIAGFGIVGAAARRRRTAIA